MKFRMVSVPVVLCLIYLATPLTVEQILCSPDSLCSDACATSPSKSLNFRVSTWYRTCLQQWCGVHVLRA